MRAIEILFWRRARTFSQRRAVRERLASVTECLRPAIDETPDLGRLRSESSITILAFVPQGRDAETLQTTAAHERWSIASAHDWDKGIKLLNVWQPGLILLDYRLIEPDWRHALHTSLLPQSRPCVVLISPRTDDAFWESVIREGGYDVLPTPIEMGTLIRTVQFAWDYRAACSVHTY